MADTTLTPEELDALSAGVDSGEIEVDTGLNVHANVVKHDLTAEDSTLGINLSAIDMVNERFVRMFRLGLLEVLRTSPRVNLTKAKILARNWQMLCLWYYVWLTKQVSIYNKLSIKS